MKIFIAAGIAVLLFTFSGLAQRNVTPVIDRDPVMEQDAKHNLDVAWQSYKLKKAYKGVLMRFEETYAAYPDFSKIDEFLYLAGMSSYLLANNKGSQIIDPVTDKDKDKYAPEKLKEDAAAYFWTIVEEYPESKYKGEAVKMMAVLKPGK